MEFQMAWLWPLVICVAALALRLWVTPRLEGQRKSTPARPWMPAFLRGNRPDTAPITVLGRKSINAHQAIVLVRVWDQELALCVQAGTAPVVIASREAAPDTGKQSSAQETGGIFHASSPPSTPSSPSVGVCHGVSNGSYWGDNSFLSGSMSAERALKNVSPCSNAHRDVARPVVEPGVARRGGLS